MNRSEIEVKVQRILDAHERSAKASSSVYHDRAPKAMEAAKQEVKDAELEGKAAIVDIVVDTLLVLHRIADALEGKPCPT